MAVWRCLISTALVLGAPLLNAAVPEDPWEDLNRKVFVFNDTVDAYVLKPVAESYNTVMPQAGNDMVTNFFENLAEVRTIINDVLQGKMGQAGADTGRFLINSTVGFLGFFDVATRMGMTQHKEDFGQTLATWGMGSGPYVVLPFYGPSTVRDGAGLVPQWYTSPYRTLEDDTRSANSLFVVDVVDTRADLVKAESLIIGDKYTFFRDAYLQRREYLIQDGNVKDDFGDDEDSGFDEEF